MASVSRPTNRPAYSPNLVEGAFPEVCMQDLEQSVLKSAFRGERGPVITSSDHTICGGRIKLRDLEWDAVAPHFLAVRLPASIPQKTRSSMLDIVAP